ncbi:MULTISPECIES: RnfH family protein [Caldimonas]|uniref:RnfH family protein n=1 Tax=Caldimonas TaxID=196013 RepID=UPI00037CD011|nr:MULTISPECIES: RnfH family protein [Caldimonas]MCX7659105.1 RnfH family protein [Caldimonas manganoxidans]GIX25266.1 MAG: UPF0125 protein [Caldimonas sp.]
MGHVEMKVEVVYAPAPHCVDRVSLDLPEGATVRHALQASGILQRHQGLLDAGGHRVGIWGRLAGLDDALRERDRVEIYRPLKVDPKEARRLRYRQQAPSGRRRRPAR